MEDRWGDLDDKIVLEEGKILVEFGNKLEEGDLHNIQFREIQVFNPLNSQDDIDTPRNEPLLLEVLKENGEYSKYKPNQRKRAEKRETLRG